MTRHKKSDEALHLDVLNELKWDAHVDEADVGVQVKNGVVTLFGTISDWGKRLAAEAAAHRVAGVLDVANDIKVVPSISATRSDTEIAEAVRQTLKWDVFVPDERIRSTVVCGVVTLTGEVDRAQQKQDAERAIRNLAGVRIVLNQIVVAPKVEIDADQVRDAIIEALERQTDREAHRIQVRASGSRVMISGRVHSWAEREAVIGTARGTHGVVTIEDQLQIDSMGR